MWGIATMSFTGFAIQYLATCLQGGLFGIYSGLFAIHLALHAAKRETDNSKPNIIFYSLCVLYVLTVALFAITIALNASPSIDNIATLVYGLGVSSTTLFGCCDFIAQCILIHRCWVVCGQNIRVIILPSILAFAYLVMWLAGNGSFVIVQNEVGENVWGNRLALTSVITSLTVNALVTGLIVFKIFKTFRRVKSLTTSEERSLGIGGGAKIRSVIFVIIESGMVLFAVQLARLVVTISQPALGDPDAASYAFEFIIAIHQMVNGITPTIILVRVSLGLSFHDKESLDEAVGSLQFAADDPNSFPEAGSIDQDSRSHIGYDDDLNPLPVMRNINQERRDAIGRSDDIQIVDR